MSYCHQGPGINFNLGFGPQPGNYIRSRVNNCSTVDAYYILPTNPTTSNINYTTATVSWTIPLTSTSFTVRYRQVGATTWQTTSTTGSSKNLTNLASGVQYEWQVTGDCSSAYTSSVVFTTLSNATIATGSVPTLVCRNTSIPVNFTVGGTFNSGNVFTAQLSNSSGSFSSPVNIGTRNATTAGTINAMIPVATPAGTGYRIRVISSSPGKTGTDNGSNITINAIPAAPTASSFSRCGAGTVALSASGCSGGTMKWYANATATAVLNTGSSYTTPSISSTTVYYVNCTVGTCVSNRTAVTATITPPPAAPTASSFSRCGAGTVALSASGCSGGTMKWYANATATAVLNTGSSYTTPSISSTTVYYVNCTVGTCVSNRTAVTATITPPPAAPTASSFSRCGAGTVALSASGCSGGTMKWYANATATAVLNTGSSYTTPSISSTTVYYVNCTVGNCISNRTAVTATITPLPAAPTASSFSRCGAGTVALSASGCSGGTMKWYANTTATAVLNTGNSYTTPSISSTTVYYVNCTVGTCVSNRTAVTATITPPPAAPTASSFSRCGAGTVALSASGCSGGTMKWYANATATAVLNTGSSYTTPSISSTTVYYVNCTVGNCISNRTAVTATITPLPAAPTASSFSRCGAGTVALSASGCSGGTMKWYANTTATAVLNTGNSYTTPSISSTTVYYVNCTVGTCVSNRTAVTATITPPPAAPTASSFSRCGAGTVALSASGCSGGTMKWYANATATAVLNTGSSYTTPSISSTTVYYVNCTVGNCISNRTAVTAIITPPPAAPTASSFSRCGAGTVALSASGCSGGTMKWYANATATAVLNTGSSYTTPSISSTTVYYVNCTVGNCISNRTAVTAIITPPPAAPTASSFSRCGAGTVALSASGCSGGTMKWYANATATAVLNTGSSYTTPSISSTTVYYVNCTVGTCVSNRTAVTATVNVNLSFTNPTQASGTYRASHTITSASNVANPTNYFAGKTILLVPGFQVASGEVFLASIQDCQ